MKRLLLVIAMVVGAKRATACENFDQSHSDFLLEQGAKLRDEGKPWQQYCPKFLEADKLWPVKVWETEHPRKWEAAECFALEGNTASAYAKYQQTLEIIALFQKAHEYVLAAQLARVEAKTKERLQALEPKLSKLTIHVDFIVNGLLVRAGGEVVSFMDYDHPKMRDPQSIPIVAEAPGFKPFETDITIKDPGVTTVTIPRLPSVCWGNEYWRQGACQCVAGLVHADGKCVVPKI
jgi:hypothetical protein